MQGATGNSFHSRYPVLLTFLPVFLAREEVNCAVSRPRVPYGKKYPGAALRFQFFRHRTGTGYCCATHTCRLFTAATKAQQLQLIHQCVSASPILLCISPQLY
jgi:hypothetical protein